MKDQLHKRRLKKAQPRVQPLFSGHLFLAMLATFPVSTELPLCEDTFGNDAENTDTVVMQSRKLNFGGEFQKPRSLDKLGQVDSNMSLSTMAPDDWDDLSENGDDCEDDGFVPDIELEIPSACTRKRVSFVDKVETWEVTIEDGCQLFPVNRSSRVVAPKVQADDCCFRILKLGLKLLFF